MQITEEKKEAIKKEATQILDNFSKALENVKFSVSKKEPKEGAGGFREEGQGIVGDTDFRARMFANAPNKDKDFVIAEKKKW